MLARRNERNRFQRPHEVRGLAPHGFQGLGLCLLWAGCLTFVSSATQGVFVGHRHLPVISLIMAVLAAIPGSARAQDSQTATEIRFTEKQASELKTWISEDAKWEKWNKQWGNKVLSHPVRHRPAPPAWLAEECSQLIGGEGLLVQACSHLKEISEDSNTAYIRKAMAAQRKQQESSKTRFIERVHFGAGWPLMQVGAFKYGGLFESEGGCAGIRPGVGDVQVKHVRLSDTRDTEISQPETQCDICSQLDESSPVSVGHGEDQNSRQIEPNAPQMGD